MAELGSNIFLYDFKAFELWNGLGIFGSAIFFAYYNYPHIHTKQCLIICCGGGGEFQAWEIEFKPRLIGK